MSKEQTQKELSQEEKAIYAFFSGLILGWVSRIKDPDFDLKKLIKDMTEESDRLADLAGVERS